MIHEVCTYGSLVGNPNSGKTTVFNALTGSNQQVGNWPGVTMFKQKRGAFALEDTEVQVIDLPGTYSLIQPEAGALDEQISCQFIASRQASLLINVLDASNLERNLYLTCQLLEMGQPLIVAINMVDVALQRGISLNLAQLEARLGCPVVALFWQNDKDAAALKNKILTTAQKGITPSPSPLLLPTVDASLNRLLVTPEFAAIPADKKTLLWHALEGDKLAQEKLPLVAANLLAQEKRDLEASLGEEIDILLADARYRYAHEIAQGVCYKTGDGQQNITAFLDKWVLNRILGIPIFLAVMYGLFLALSMWPGCFKIFSIF